MQARGETIDAISNPSQAELLLKQFEGKKKDLEEAKKNEIRDKYNPISEPLDLRLRLGQTEVFTEYSREGRVVRGAAKAPVRTKYEEDVYINNHTSVWGSYFNRSRFQWGYACCHSLVKNSYCVGETGKQMNDSANNQAIDLHQERRMLEKVPGTAQTRVQTGIVKRSDVYGESSGDVVLSEEKMAEALKRAEARMKREREEAAEEEEGTRKRSYNSMQTVEVTPEDMEAYRILKSKRQDPMAELISGDEILEYNP